MVDYHDQPEQEEQSTIFNHPDHQPVFIQVINHTKQKIPSGSRCRRVTSTVPIPSRLAHISDELSNIMSIIMVIIMLCTVPAIVCPSRPTYKRKSTRSRHYHYCHRVRVPYVPIILTISAEMGGTNRGTSRLTISYQIPSPNVWRIPSGARQFVGDFRGSQFC